MNLPEGNIPIFFDKDIIAHKVSQKPNLPSRNSLLRLRKDALSIFKARVEAVSPCHAVEKFVRRKGDTLEVAGRAYDLSRYSGIYIFGAGKASPAMARHRL
ncbi:MAG: DUF4147 domain-containing protein [Candidatus Aminicenantales bacterium]